MKPENPTTPILTFESVKEVEHYSKARMDKALADLQHEMAGIRTGRASINLFDPIKVDYYGTPTPLNQLATLHVPEPSLITVQPWDVTQIGAIEKAIQKSELGLTPSNDGKLIRLSIPPLTEERRKDLVKVVKKMAEEGKVKIRNARRDANEQFKTMKKDNKISEDEMFTAQDDVQGRTDKYIEKVDVVLAAKEKEIMEI